MSKVATRAGAAVEPRPATRLACFDPGNRLTVEIISLKGSCCRWPFGDQPPYRYCGAATGDITKPYCREHAARATNPKAKGKAA